MSQANVKQIVSKIVNEFSNYTGQSDRFTAVDRLVGFGGSEIETSFEMFLERRDELPAIGIATLAGLFSPTGSKHLEFVVRSVLVFAQELRWSTDPVIFGPKPSFSPPHLQLQFFDCFCSVGWRALARRQNRFAGMSEILRSGEQSVVQCAIAYCDLMEGRVALDGPAFAGVVAMIEALRYSEIGVIARQSQYSMLEIEKYMHLV